MTDHHLSLERPYKQQNPLDMDDAREAARRVTRLRRDAEGHYRAAIHDRARKEGDYRKALAKRIVELRSEGVGAGEALERAKGDCYEELIAFRVAEGMQKACEERVEGVDGERSQLKALIDYSARISSLLMEGPTEPRPPLRSAA